MTHRGTVRQPFPAILFMPEYILKRDGAVVRRPIEMTIEGEQEINIDDAILSQIRTRVAVKVPRLGMMGDRMVSLCCLDTTWYARVRLEVLKLNCTVRPVDKLVIPDFKQAGDFVGLEWVVPADMRLIFAANIYEKNNVFFSEYMYLFAIMTDGSNRAFLLPLPNLYGDGHLCTGIARYQGNSVLDCFQNCYVGVRDSRWNHHLIHDNAGVFENSQKLFRFKPLTEGFETVPTETPWDKLCRPVGTEVLNYLCL